MKKKIALLLVLVLSLSVVLAACSSSCDEHVDADRNEICDVCEEYVQYVPAYLGFEGIYKTTLEEEEDDSILYSKAELDSALTDMTVDYNYYGNNLVIFRNYEAEAGETKAIVFNTETTEKVLTLDKEDDDATVIKTVSIDTANYDSFIRVTETDTTDRNTTLYKQTLYTALGEEITSKQSKVNATISISRVGYTADYEGSVYVIEDKVYEIIDDVATYKFDKGFSNIQSISNMDYTTDKNYYAYSSSNVRVYDLQFNLVAYYSVPAGYSITTSNVLSDGNVLIQYIKMLPWDAEEYDIYVTEEAEQKIEYHTVIFNIADESVKAIELNYYINRIRNAAVDPEWFEEHFVDGAIENYAVVYPIVNKAVDFNNPVYANFDNNMFLIGFLGEEIANQFGIVTPIADNRFTVSNKAGQKFLLNEKAEIIGEITNASYNSDLQLFYTNGKYYDLDLKLVFDENEVEYSRYYYNGSSSKYSIYYDTKIIGEGEDEETVTTYYIRNDITFTELNLPENFYGLYVDENYFTYNYYVEDEDEGTTTYYTVYCNANGEKIHTINTSAENYRDHSVSSYGDVLVIALQTYKDNGGYSTKYYIAK